MKFRKHQVSKCTLNCFNAHLTLSFYQIERVEKVAANCVQLTANCAARCPQFQRPVNCAARCPQFQRPVNCAARRPLQAILFLRHDMSSISDKHFVHLLQTQQNFNNFNVQLTALLDVPCKQSYFCAMICPPSQISTLCIYCKLSKSSIVAFTLTEMLTN